MDTTTRSAPADTTSGADLGVEPLRIFISLDEAGAMVQRSARWVERHLVLNARNGAPALVVVPSCGSSGRAAGKLVDRNDWLAWVRSWAYTCPRSGSGRMDRPSVPLALLSPSKRQRIARGF